MRLQQSCVVVAVSTEATTNNSNKEEEEEEKSHSQCFSFSVISRSTSQWRWPPRTLTWSRTAPSGTWAPLTTRKRATLTQSSSTRSSSLTGQVSKTLFAQTSFFTAFPLHCCSRYCARQFVEENYVFDKKPISSSHLQTQLWSFFVILDTFNSLLLKAKLFQGWLQSQWSSHARIIFAYFCQTSIFALKTSQYTILIEPEMTPHPLALKVCNRAIVVDLCFGTGSEKIPWSIFKTYTRPAHTGCPTSRGAIFSPSQLTEHVAHAALDVGDVKRAPHNALTVFEMESSCEISHPGGAWQDAACWATWWVFMFMLEHSKWGNPYLPWATPKCTIFHLFRWVFINNSDFQWMPSLTLQWRQSQGCSRCALPSTVWMTDFTWRYPSKSCRCSLGSPFYLTGITCTQHCIFSTFLYEDYIEEQKWWSGLYTCMNSAFRGAANPSWFPLRCFSSPLLCLKLFENTVISQFCTFSRLHHKSSQAAFITSFLMPVATVELPKPPSSEEDVFLTLCYTCSSCRKKKSGVRLQIALL